MVQYVDKGRVWCSSYQADPAEESLTEHLIIQIITVSRFFVLFFFLFVTFNFIFEHHIQNSDIKVFHLIRASGLMSSFSSDTPILRPLFEI